MCTIGALSNLNEKGQRLGFLMKTVDAGLTETFHGFFTGPNGTRALFASMMRQRGTNIGLNQHGLAVTISYSDYRGHGSPWTKEMPTLERDTRAMACAEILSRCSSADEALAFLKDFVPRHPDQVGGNYLLIDCLGNIVLLEQCEGKYDFRSFSQRGYCGRANNSHWLIQDKQANLIVPSDSLPREEAMEKFLINGRENIPRGITSDEIISGAKYLLSSHSKRSDQLAGICAHGLEAPGARLFGSDPCHTLTAVICDLNEKTMHYSVGNPCQERWRKVTLD